MVKNLIRWMFILAALLVIGPLLGGLIGSLHAYDGSHHVTPLASAEPAKGALYLLLVLGIGAAFGTLVSKVYGIANGMTCAGLIFAWAAWNCATIDSLVRSSDSHSPLMRLAVEGLIVASVAGIAGWLIQRQSVQARMDASLRITPRQMFAGPGLIALGAGLAGAALVGWFVANDTLKGQAVFAAIGAGIAAGAAAQLAAARDASAVIPSAVLATALMALIGPVAGLLIHGGKFASVAASGTVFGLAIPVPLDWLAGAFIGVPMGVQWAGSMIEKRLAAAA